MKSKIAILLIVFAVVIAACATPPPNTVPKNPYAIPEISQADTLDAC